MTSSAARSAAGLLQVLAAAFVLALMPARTSAQEIGFDSVGGRELGPLGVKPQIMWNTEYDDNLFRSNTPVSDVISTVGTMTTVRGQMRRVSLNANGSADWVHYAKLVSERGANVAGTLRLDFHLNHFVPYVTATYGNTRQRQNPELDIRPRLEQTTLGAGGLILLGSKTAFDVSVGRGKDAYAQNAEADGVKVGDALNRRSDQVALKLFREITPLTRINVTGEMYRNRFDDSSRRNADNFRLTTGFDSIGRVNGHARVGLRVLRPEDPRLPESRGLYLSVGTTATVGDRLLIGVDAERDVAPSYRSGAMYYEFYSYGGTITGALIRSLKLTAHVSRRIADYPAAIGGISLPNQLGTDRETRYASGIRYHLGDSMAIDVTGAYTNRTSTVASRQFDSVSLRAGVSHAF